jgi:hypothetical protein
MKKVLLLIASLFIFIPAAVAYQTVLINFPPEQGWHCVYYRSIGDEAILQYTPRGQSPKYWSRTLIFHSYKNSRYDSLSKFSQNIFYQMQALNPSGGYSYIKNDENDIIATRCVSHPSQCEILRSSETYEGYLTMQYINKNVPDFKRNYNFWLDIVRTIRIYYSYYMDERILNKATSFHI